MSRKIFSHCMAAAVFAAMISVRTGSGQSLLGAAPRKPVTAVKVTTDNRPSNDPKKAESTKPSSKKTSRTRRGSAVKTSAKSSRTAATTQPAGTATTQPADGATSTAGKAGATLDNVALQSALDRAGFSPGVIDGSPGHKTVVALRAYQAFASLPVTGKADDATRQGLGLDAKPPTRSYLITSSDTDLVAPPPKTWPEKAKARLLGYQALLPLVAERGHCTTALIAKLNRGIDTRNLKIGQAITIPNVEDAAKPAKATALEVDLAEKMIRVVGDGNKVVGLYHCSIAADRRKRPAEACSVKTIVDNPKYWFDPANWPEVRDVKEKLVIPPGPRNPVGLCWIGLSKEGYGIHGTPEPENIGKTGSHGCFRMTNWDATRLARMVQVGTEVRFSDEPAPTAADDVKPPVTRVSTRPKASGKSTIKKTSAH